jgi:hypothetical protein
MIADDLRNLSDTAELRARLNQPLGVAELHGLAATLRSLADRTAVLESYPIPRAARFRVIEGNGGDAA